MNTITEEKLGDMAISSGVVRISDPCYDKDVHCTGVIKNVKTGVWKPYVVLSDEGSWGIRNAVLVAHHSDHPIVESSLAWKKKRIDVGVDSGSAGIYDEAYFKGGEDDYGDDGWYDDNCNIVLKSQHSAGVLPDNMGVVSSSGFGDGGYNCYVATSGKKVVAIKIDFGVIER